MNNVEYIKTEFKNYYIDNGPENGILQGMKYHGSATHCRACLNTIVRILKPKTILEIGSWHYESSIAMSKGMDAYLTPNEGLIHSYDIKTGGYDGLGRIDNLPSRISPFFWYPYHTSYDPWKYTDSGIVFKDFINYTNEELSDMNDKILKTNAPNNGYDLIFLDGDHSYDGVKKDWDHVKNISNENTVVVIDNIWDSRLIEVRRFFNELQTPKWDFEDWNDANPTYIQDTGIALIGDL